MIQFGALLPTQEQINQKGLDAIFIVLANAINYALFIAGALALIYLLIGAFQYTTSAGNPQNVAQAKRTITFAVVGLVVVILTLVIVKFVRGLFI
jgi:hypothetical protein